VMNWMVDFYSFGSMTAAISDLQLLHTDTLRNTSEVVCYWKQLVENMKNGVEVVASQNNTFGMLTLLSFSLHAVQDFYSHSNWVETHPRNGTCGCYRTDTWFTYANTSEDLPIIFSDACEMCPRVDHRNTPAIIPHGWYCEGMNKDSIVRPNHEEAFVYAYIASVEWINATKAWSDKVNPDFWPRLLTYDEVDPSRDWDTAYKLSLWVQTGPKADGHWKGSGSGNALKALFRYLSWSIHSDSKLISRVKSQKIWKLLTNPSLYRMCGNSSTNNETVKPISSQFKQNLRAVIIRTTELFKTEERDLESVVRRNFTDVRKSRFSLYAVITIGDQVFIEPTQQGIVHPFWTSIKLVNIETNETDPTIEIKYELWQENAWRSDTLENINTDRNRTKGRSLSLTYHLNSHLVEGDFHGVFDTPQKPIFAAGRQSYVKFYITTSSLSECVNFTYYGKVVENSPPQCGATSPARNGLAYVCSKKGEAEAMTQVRNAVVVVSLPLGFLILSCLLGVVLYCSSKWRHKKRRHNKENNVRIPAFESERDPLLTDSAHVPRYQQ